MAPTDKGADQPLPIHTSRHFAAPRALVFRAWSSAEHVKNWFCPAGFSVPEARVEMQAGGAFELCMRGPDGSDNWTRGTVLEVSPPDRLVLALSVFYPSGERVCHVRIEVNFVEEAGGTRMDVVHAYHFDRPEEAAPILEHAPVGGAQTLDHLEQELLRMQRRSVVHGMFTLKRSYAAPVSRVFKAFSDPAAKALWFGGPADQWAELERQMDFRVGGREVARGRWKSGVVTRFDAIYHDIIPDQRIIYTYEMHVDDRKISVSLATLQMKAEGPGRTTLTVTEHGAFLDGYDDAGSREHGTGILLDTLGASLQAE